MDFMAEAMSIGIAVAGSIVAGVFVGYLLDTKVVPKLFDKKTYPWLTIIFLIFGVIGGFKNLLMMSKRGLKR